MKKLSIPALLCIILPIQNMEQKEIKKTKSVSWANLPDQVIDKATRRVSRSILPTKSINTNNPSRSDSTLQDLQPTEDIFK